MNLAPIESVGWKRERFRLSAIGHVPFSNPLSYKIIYLEVTVIVPHRKLFTRNYKNILYIKFIFSKFLFSIYTVNWKSRNISHLVSVVALVQRLKLAHSNGSNPVCVF
jgi:hypothetical protein